MNEDLIDELQMLTGVQSNDSDYLFYLLMKDGCYFKDKEKEKKRKEISSNAVSSFEDWFNSLEV